MPRGSGTIQPVAEWLCDAYGEDNETHHDFIEDARDLVNFMESRGVMVRKRTGSFHAKPKVDFKPKARR